MNFLEKVNEVSGSVNVNKPVFKITQDKMNMLMKSEENILNGHCITDEELNGEEDKWLNE
jgi:hypothetical protein